MTTAEYEVVVTLLNGHARELSRTFTSGLALAPLSIGSQGDWLLSAEGVASVHLWLRFDGQRLYAASASADAAAYLQDLRIGNTWQEVADRSELRVGQARLMVSRRPIGVSAPVSPPVPARVEARPLTPIERAAALPLPSFFTDRLREGRDPSAVAPDPHRLRSGDPHARPRNPARAAAIASRQRRNGRWLLLVIPAGLLPFIIFFLWVIGFGRHGAELPAAAPTSSAKTLPPAQRTIEGLAERPMEQPVLQSLPAPLSAEKPAAVRPIVTEGFAPTRTLPSAQPRAYPQKIADKPVPRIGAEPWMISEEWRAHHERQLQAPNRARAKVIFLGDSITEGWGVTPAYRDKFANYSPLNLGIAGDVTQNVLWRIDHGALDGTHPEVLVLMIGVNNLAGGFSAQDTVAGIKAILVAVQAHLPNTRVLLLGILPARQSPDDPLRQRIVEANRALASLPASTHVSVHDVGAVLLEADGTITKATLRDFVHPTAAGYARLSEAVAPLIDALMSAPSSERAASESPSQAQ